MGLSIYEPEGFSLQIFRDRYSFTTEESWQEACSRIATQVASAELPTKQSIYRDKFTVAFCVILPSLFIEIRKLILNKEVKIFHNGV